VSRELTVVPNGPDERDREHRESAGAERDGERHCTHQLRGRQTLGEAWDGGKERKGCRTAQCESQTCPEAIRPHAPPQEVMTRQPAEAGYITP